MSEKFEPTDFSNVYEGDRVQFVTANNGFDGGDDVWRTGTVTKVTAATVVVACEGSILGPTAVLRRIGWNARCVSKVITEKPVHRPYDAKHVQIVDMGHTVWALYIPDPEQAKDPRHVLDNILDRSKYDDVEIVATATRLYKSQGAAVSGWIIASGPEHGSEGYPNKLEMRQALHLVIGQYFTPAAPFTAGTIVEGPQDAPAAPESAPTVIETGDCTAHGIAGKFGAHAAALNVTCCAAGTTYGVWDRLAGGFTFTADCATEAANWAAEQLDEDPDGDMDITAVCRDHAEQPADSCEDCYDDEEGN